MNIYENKNHMAERTRTLVHLYNIQSSCRTLSSFFTWITKAKWNRILSIRPWYIPIHQYIPLVLCYQRIKNEFFLLHDKKLWHYRVHPWSFHSRNCQQVRVIKSGIGDKYPCPLPNPVPPPPFPLQNRACSSAREQIRGRKDLLPLTSSEITCLRIRTWRTPGWLHWENPDSILFLLDSICLFLLHLSNLHQFLMTTKTFSLCAFIYLHLERRWDLHRSLMDVNHLQFATLGNEKQEELLKTITLKV